MHGRRGLRLRQPSGLLEELVERIILTVVATQQRLLVAGLGRAVNRTT